MTATEQYQLGAVAPKLYERYLVPAITSLWAADLIERAEPRVGDRILDVACGTGIVARLAATRIGTGEVVGIDLNPGMLGVARSVSLQAGLRIEWREGNVLAMPFGAATFDIVFCQLGLQFFPDRLAALGE